MPKFKPGQSGNPKGRPKSAMTRQQLRKTIADELPCIIGDLISKAKAISGDAPSAKLELGS